MTKFITLAASLATATATNTAVNPRMSTTRLRHVSSEKFCQKIQKYGEVSGDCEALQTMLVEFLENEDTDKVNRCLENLEILELFWELTDFSVCAKKYSDVANAQDCVDNLYNAQVACHSSEKYYAGSECRQFYTLANEVANMADLGSKKQVNPDNLFLYETQYDNKFPFPKPCQAVNYELQVYDYDSEVPESYVEAEEEEENDAYVEENEETEEVSEEEDAEVEAEEEYEEEEYDEYPEETQEADSSLPSVNCGTVTYTMSDSTAYFEEAVENCQNQGGSLAAFQTAAEQTCLQGLTIDSEAWIGLRAKDPNTDAFCDRLSNNCRESVSFGWNNGALYNSVLTADAQVPAGSTFANYVYLDTAHGLNYGAAWGSRNFICENRAGARKRREATGVGWVSLIISEKKEQKLNE